MIFTSRKSCAIPSTLHLHHHISCYNIYLGCREFCFCRPHRNKVRDKEMAWTLSAAPNRLLLSPLPTHLSSFPNACLWASNSNRGHRDTCLPVASLLSPTLSTQLAETNPWGHTPHPPTYPSGGCYFWMAGSLPRDSEIVQTRGRQSVRHIGSQHSQSPILQKIIEAVTVYLTITTRWIPGQ